jgi:hypothetical protein
MEEEHEDHGHSVAAWTLVSIVLVGCVVVSVAVVIASVILGIIGVVVIVVGVIAGKVLSMAGYGSKGHPTHHETFLADAPQESGAKTVGKS